MFSWRPFDALNPRDLHDILKLRSDVFVVEQGCVSPEIDGRDPDAPHLLARAAEGGPLAGTPRPPPFPGFHVYSSSRRQMRLVLAALLDVLRFRR